MKKQVNRIVIKPIGISTILFVKRAFLLLYKACDPAAKMGLLQATRVQGRAYDIEEETVWRCVFNSEDYPASHNKEGDVYGDYVFGRMMKWGCRYDDETITVQNFTFSNDYESFCDIYPDNKSIFDAVAKSLECEYEVIEES